MSAQTELAVVPPPETALAVFSAVNGLEPWLQQIRTEIDGFTPDISSRKGRDAIASMAYKIARSKTALDDVGKKLVADLKEVPKKIDAERKRVRDTLEVWQEEVRRPLNEWQAAEDARVDRHNDAIDRIKAHAIDLDGITAEDLADRVEKLEAIAMGESWEEFDAEAARAKDAALDKLRTALTARQQYDEQQAELARLREEATAREQKDREDQIAREAVAKAQREADERAQAERNAVAKREAEAKAAADRRELELKLAAEQSERAATQAAREKIESEQRAAQQKIDDEQRHQRAMAQAEADRVAAEQRAEQERVNSEARQAEAAERARLAEVARQKAADEEILRQEKLREADKAHKARINRASLDAFVAGGMTEECAKQAITLIAKRQIPAIQITY